MIITNIEKTGTCETGKVGAPGNKNRWLSYLVFLGVV